MLMFLLSVCDETDREKIEYLYRAYHDKMLRLARWRLKLSGWKSYAQDAEDVVQEAFIKLVKYVHQIRFDEDSHAIEAYVLTTVVHAVSNFLNANSKASVRYIEDITEPIYDEDASFAFEEVETAEGYNKIIREMLVMDEIYAAPLLMRYCMEFTVREIADILSIPEKTVYTRLGRGIERIKRILRSEAGYEEK